MVDMTFEKIEKQDELEHPAHRAARMIKELHEENLNMIAGGYVFLRDGVDVNETIIASCKEQIAQCNKIMAHVNDPDYKPWTKIPEFTENVITDTNGVPEIGNYDHEENS